MRGLVTTPKMAGELALVRWPLLRCESGGYRQTGHFLAILCGVSKKRHITRMAPD